MSFMLDCPNCGAREVYEFRYGGQVLDTTPSLLSGPAELENVHNLPGKQRELWYHRLGCRRWLCAERDIRTNAVLSVGLVVEGEAS